MNSAPASRSLQVRSTVVLGTGLPAAFVTRPTRMNLPAKLASFRVLLPAWITMPRITNAGCPMAGGLQFSVYVPGGILRKRYLPATSAVSRYRAPSLLIRATL